MYNLFKVKFMRPQFSDAKQKLPIICSFNWEVKIVELGEVLYVWRFHNFCQQQQQQKKKKKKKKKK